MKLSLKYKKAFTLVELMVTIAVISLLAAIVTNSLNDAQNASKNSVVNQEIVSWVNALELYRAEEGDFPLASWGSGATACLGEGGVGTLSCATTAYDNEFGNAMDTYIDKTKNPNRAPIEFFAGPQMAFYIYQEPHVEIYWFLNGDVDCIKGATKAPGPVNTMCILTVH